MGDGIQVENLLNSYVVLDVETTGLHSDDRVIEIGAAKVIDGQIVEEFQQLINPEMVIPPFITSLTGISNDMVADAPTMKTVLPLFISFMDSLPIVGHNVGFDCSMLRWEAARVGTSIEFKKGDDTRYMACRRYPRWPNHSLWMLCAMLGVDGRGAHRALADVRATQKAYEILKETPLASESYWTIHRQANRVGPNPDELYEMAQANHVDFHGMSFVITGECPLMNREEATALIEKLNGVVRTKVSAKTGCLIYEPNFVSTKSTKAKELIAAGAPIAMMSMEEFLHTLGYSETDEE